jgi:hypothetical protein
VGNCKDYVPSVTGLCLSYRIGGSFAADTDRGRDAYYCAPPHRAGTCGFPAYGSHLECLTASRIETAYRAGLRMTRGQCRSLFFHCMTLAFTTLAGLTGALELSNPYHVPVYPGALYPRDALQCPPM